MTLMGVRLTIPGKWELWFQVDQDETNLAPDVSWYSDISSG